MLEMTGAIDASSMPAATDVITSEWWSDGADEVEVGDLDALFMPDLGLDPEDPADVDRYRFIVRGADYRFLATEPGPAIDEWIRARNKDISVYYFDLAGHPADLEHPIPIFDLSPVEEARASGSREALGAALRRAVDTIRNNGHPDVVIAYAADRVDEGWGNTTASLLSPSARLASGGQAWIHAVHAGGGVLTTIPADLESAASLSIRVEAVFPDPEDTMRIEGSCLAVEARSG
jgi:hypothetical protein